MSHQWDPERYLVYADERGRPFVDLLARVGATDPGRVVDLGCGPGNLTVLLKERWPSAKGPMRTCGGSSPSTPHRRWWPAPPVSRGSGSSRAT